MRRSRRHTVLAVVGVAAAAAISLPILASADTAAPAPDLRADPVEGIAGPQVYFTSGYGANELLLRFDGFVTNVGQGPLEVSGNPQVPGDVRQRSWGAGEGPGTFASEPVGPARVTFETADGHDHFHLAHAMRYSLWNLDRDGPGRARPEGGLLPLRHRGRAAARAAARARGLHRGRDRVLRRRAPGVDRPAHGHLAGVARRLRQVARLPVDRRLQHAPGPLPGGLGGRSGQRHLGGRRGRRGERGRVRLAAGDRAGLGRPAGGRGPDGRRPDRPARRGQVRRPERRQPALPGDRGAGARHPERRDRGRLPRDRAAGLHAGAGLRAGRTRSPTWPARPARPSR